MPNPKGNPLITVMSCGKVLFFRSQSALSQYFGLTPSQYITDALRGYHTSHGVETKCSNIIQSGVLEGIQVYKYDEAPVYLLPDLEYTLIKYGYDFTYLYEVFDYFSDIREDTLEGTARAIINSIFSCN